MPTPFAHLHAHSEFSLLDGASRIKDMVSYAVENDMPALALTDHGTMYGCFDFYTQAKAAGIKGIVGCELYVATRHRTQREAGIDGNHHLVALAKNEIGYKNLMKLVSLASLEGMYYRPRVDKELLAEYAEGLIISSACMGGELAKTIMDEGRADASLVEAKNVAAWYREIYGDDFYLEIQGHSAPGQHELNQAVIRIARQMKIKLVATNDSHYTKAGDAGAHDVLICIQTGTNVHDPKRMRYEPREFYLKTHQEMRDCLGKIAPDAIENTMEVAEKVNLSIKTGRTPMPAIGLLEGLDADDTLSHIAEQGLVRRLQKASGGYSRVVPPIHKERLEYELGVIKQMGFSQYMLIVADITQHAREQHIRFGPRGSAAGCLVSYAIGITDIDPIEYNLVFERFLNPERVSMPDIDLDFQDNRRHEIVEHLVRTLGEESVGHITTFGTLAAKAAIRDAGRALALPYAEVSRIADLIPKMPLGLTIEKAMNGWPEKEYEGSRELLQEYQENAQTRGLLDTAQRIEGISRNESVHAAGVIIADRPLTEYTPVRRVKLSGGNQVVATQYPHAALEEIGLLKMDLLGLINLTIVDIAIGLIAKHRNETVDIWDIPLKYGDDERAKRTYDMLGRGQTTGVFQLESDGMRRYITELKPESVMELSAMVALYRPGPMSHIPRYIRGKFDRNSVTYNHPVLEPILRSTYGVIVYQDQVLQIARAVGGMSLGQADLLRRAMGKKKAKEMAEQRERFLGGAFEKGIRMDVAEEIFNAIEPFAGYAFNGAHAACYAMLAYQTAYLKANYPAEYMAAFMTAFSEKNRADKIAAAIAECANLGISVLPPDINVSGLDFTPDGNTIRFGLGAIKSLGDSQAKSVIEAREAGDVFGSIEEVATRAYESGLRHGTALSYLYRSGAMSGIDGLASPNFVGAEEAIESAWKNKEKPEQVRLMDMDDDPAFFTAFHSVETKPKTAVHIEGITEAIPLLHESLSAMPGLSPVVLHVSLPSKNTSVLQTGMLINLTEESKQAICQIPGILRVWCEQV